MMRTSAAPNRTVLVATFSSNIFGIARHTGQILWEVPLGSHGEADLHVLDEVTIAITHSDLHFLVTLTGQVLARVPLGMNYPRRPTSLVDEGHLYVAANGEIVCFTLRGERVWHQPFKGKGMGSVALGLPGNVRQADDVGSK